MMRAGGRMKKLIAVVVAVLAALALAGGALYLGFALALGTTTGGCPTALLQGTLVEVDATLGVESVPPGSVSTVDWPFGYGVGEEDGTLILTRLFTTVAREGDQVSVGGGSSSNDAIWTACGSVSLGLLWKPEEIPSEPARATLTVTAIAHEPCIPPPSGCGYWVNLTSPVFGTDRAPLTHHRSYESAANGDPEPLTLGEGLAPRIEPGRYDLTFEVGAYSDTQSPVVGPRGSLGYPPRVSVACTEHLVVPTGVTAVTVAVDFHGSTCEVAVGW
jgi:hypothetical protein